MSLWKLISFFIVLVFVNRFTYPYMDIAPKRFGSGTVPRHRGGRGKTNRKETFTMPQIHHVKKAPKANKAAGVKKGQPYWWAESWSGYRKTKSVWPNPPSALQLAELQYVENVLSIQHDMYAARPKDASDLEEMRDLWVEQIREIAEDCSVQFDDLADDLQQGPSGKLLEDRAADMDQWAVDVEAVELDRDEDEHADEGVTWDEHALELIDEMAIGCPE